MRSELAAARAAVQARAAAGPGAGAPGGVAALSHASLETSSRGSTSSCRSSRSVATSCAAARDGEAPLQARSPGARAGADGSRAGRGGAHAARIASESSMRCCGSATRDAPRSINRSSRLARPWMRRAWRRSRSECGARAVAEQLAGNHNSSLPSLLAGLAAEAAGARPGKPSLEETKGKIERLGQVNLAAIGEFKEQSERKEYLDRQCKDLTDALETLESAMRKIDRGDPLALPGHFRSRERRSEGEIPAPVRRRACLSRADGRGAGGGRRLRDGPPAGQAQQHHPPVVGWRKGADRGGAGVLDFRSEPGAVLPAGRGGCPARREQRRPLLRHRARNVAAACSSFSSLTTRPPWNWPRSWSASPDEPGVSRLVAVDVDEAVRMAAM